MKGSENVRFCGHCAFEVNDLSALTRKQARRIVSRSKGRICVRYVKNPATGAPVFAGGKLYRITRRAGFAAGVLGAALAVSTLAHAQPNRPVSLTQKTEIAQPETAEKEKSEGGAAVISGTISDPNGAVIPNATVTLTAAETSYSKTVAADENGFYEFENVRAGKYKMQATSPGFAVATTEKDVAVNQKSVADMQLEVAMLMGEIVALEYATPLFRAVSADDAEQVRELLARGESVNARDENYNRITALFIAVENGSPEIAEMLLNFGAKINVRDENRQTPLMRLDEDASPALVDLLIKHGARVDLTDDEANTPLMLAARAVKPEVLQILLRHADDLDARNRAGRTALMEAADADNLENVRLLLAAGADAALKDNAGETAFDLTTDEEIETLLVEFGAAEPLNDSL